MSHRKLRKLYKAIMFIRTNTILYCDADRALDNMLEELKELRNDQTDLCNSK